MFDHQDLLNAISCASQESGLYWDGKSLPIFTQLQSAYIPNTGIQITNSGQPVTNSDRAQGDYKWGPNELVVGQMADKPALVHEATHYLQRMNGLFAGAPASPQRQKIEAQARHSEYLAPYDCMGMFGDWNSGLLAKYQGQKK